MVYWYVVAKCEWLGPNFYQAEYLDMDGYTEGTMGSQKIESEGEVGDPFLAYGIDTQTWAYGQAQMEIGLIGSHRIRINSSGVRIWTAGDVWEDPLTAGGGGNLDDLDDVIITTPADNEVLAYNNATSQWINQTAAQAGLATTGDLHAEAHVLATTGPHTGTLPWTDLNKTGSNLTDIPTRNHNDLLNIDAGDINHLTDVQVTALHSIYTLEQHDNTYHSTNYHTETDGTGVATVHSDINSTGSQSIITTAERNALHTIYSLEQHDNTYHSTNYKVDFSENTGFNKDFGTTTGTVAQGNDSRFHTPVVAGDLNHNDLANIDAGDINHLTDDQITALHATYTNAEAVQAVEDAGLIMENPIDMKTNLLTVGDSADTSDPIELLKFETERAWSFRKRGVGSGSILSLESDVDSKQFWVGYDDGTAWCAKFTVQSVQANNILYLQALSVAANIAVGGTVDGVDVGDLKTAFDALSYYTQAELNGGQLNNIYYTETEINANTYTRAQVDAHNWLEADITDLDHLTEGEISLANLLEKSHLSLSNVTANQHHTQVHSFNEHNDVVITTPADNEVLAYNNATSQWINQTAAQAGLSVLAHLHDDRYYTEGEVNGLLHAEAHVLAATGPHTGLLPWTDLSKAGSNLTDLVTRQHAGLSDILANQHHNQAHDLASHSTKAHSELTDYNAEANVKHLTDAQVAALHATYTDAEAVQAVEDAGLVLTASKVISFNADPADTVYSGIVIDIDTTGCNNYDLVYVDGDNSVAPADATDDTKMPAIGIVVAAGKVLTHGVVKDDDLIKCTTPNAVVYASTTLREVTETAPNAAGEMIQVVGICVADHTLYVNVSLDMVEFV